MRDPDRIPLILAAIERAWRQSPDQRLGQLLSNATHIYSDLFGVEDDRLLSRLGPLTEEEQRYVNEEPERRLQARRQAFVRMTEVAAGLVERHTFVCGVCGAEERVTAYRGMMPLAPLAGWEFSSDGARCPRCHS